MRGRFIVVLGLALVGPSIAIGADPVTAVPSAERVEVTTPAVVPPAKAANEKPKPVENPKPVEKPKLLEKPRPAVENARLPEVGPSKSVEPSVPAAVPAPADIDLASKQGQASSGYSLGCLGLAFAMLIIGIAAGFLWRHLMSRHKLGGMSVRIGTWRGIP